MVLKDEERTKLRQTLAQMKHELGAIQQSLESAPQKFTEKRYGYNYSSSEQLEGYVLDEYILAFRLGNITDLSMHLQSLFHLTKSEELADGKS